MTLATEISTDPLARGYSSMTAQEVADSLNTADREVDKPVELRELISYLLKVGKWIGLDDEAASGTAVRAEATAFMVIMNNPNFTTLDLTDAIVVTMLIAIKDAGLLSNADKNTIIAMGKTLISRAQELGFGRVKGSQIGAL